MEERKFRDFLGISKSWKSKDGYDYTKYRNRYKSSLGWNSDELSKNIWSWRSSYSSEKITETEELVTSAYKNTRDMIVILDLPFKVNIFIDKKGYDKLCEVIKDQGEKRIFVSTEILDDAHISKDEKINVICGNGLHEISHLLYTRYEVVNSLFSIVSIDTKYIHLFNTIFNLIEDSRVEDLLLTERPGFFNFINSAKKRLENNYKSTSNTFFTALCGFLRFPSLLDTVDSTKLEKYSEIFEEISVEMSTLPSTTKESCTTAYRIFTILMKSPTIAEELFYLSGSSFNMEGILYNEILYGSDRDSYKDPTNTDKKISNIIKDNKIIERVVSGEAIKGKTKLAYFEKEKGNKSIYESCYIEIEKYIPSVRNLIKSSDKNYEFNIHGCRNGLLDTTKLAEAYQGVPQVYVKKGQVKTNKTTVCVLIDESGSMSWNDKYIKARQGAILLNEALGNLYGVDLYIYGHSADEICSGSTNIRIYREGNYYKPKYSLGGVTYRNENRDGTAIFEVANRVRKFTDKNCIMFILSDGEPAASCYRGDLAYEDVRRNVKKVESMGFSVIQIDIDHVRNVDKMFDKYIDIKKHISELPKKLGVIIKKTILNDKKTVIV